ncbi:MAG: hypothetical protein ACHQFX_05210 [Chitinophagales bacterium]
MFQYRQYNIRNTDRFHADDYPKVVSELEDINNGIAGLPGTHKEDIIISYLKDLSIENTWLTANPSLAELFTSGRVVTTNLRSLFESCRINDQFSEAFEQYIRKNISSV